VRRLRLGTSLSPRRVGLGIAGAVVALDQLTKWWADTVLPGSPIVLIDGFLQLRYVTNPGAAFGFFGDAGALIAFIALATIVFIIVVVRTVDRLSEAVALSLVLGGAVGNLIDRAVRGPGLLDGEVIDFVDFSFFPAFNVADSAITIGALFALWLAVRR
jgi:signal peptidase II